MTRIHSGLRWIGLSGRCAFSGWRSAAAEGMAAWSGGTTGVDDAIQTAITRASASLRNLRWFEVAQVRGAIGGDGKVDHYQVTLKAGFTLE